MKNMECQKSRFEKGFGIIVFFSTILILYILALDLLFDISSIENEVIIIDVIITIVFSIDLFFLFNKSDGMHDFLKNNWLDIISVIPFGIAFRLVKVLRVTKLVNAFSKTSKLTKVAKAAKVQKTTKVAKLSKGLRIKSELPRTGKMLSNLPKNKGEKSG